MEPWSRAFFLHTFLSFTHGTPTSLPTRVRQSIRTCDACMHAVNSLEKYSNTFRSMQCRNNTPQLRHSPFLFAGAALGAASEGEHVYLISQMQSQEGALCLEAVDDGFAQRPECG